MVSRSSTFAFSGLSAVAVEVQAHIAPGMHAFVVVGLPDKVIAESRERIRAAFHAVGLSLPYQRITLSLSPADLPKEGSHYDLPMALALLAAMEIIHGHVIERYASMGELALDGGCRAVSGCLPAAMAALAAELTLICPIANASEALMSGIDRPNRPGLVAAPDLLSLIGHLRGEHCLAPADPVSITTSGSAAPDLADIIGQSEARQALAVAAAGGHHLMMIGPPGAGKSMLAARLPSLLPPLNAAALLDVSMIASVAGQELPKTNAPPFRSPHHTSSMAALVGGGRHIKPGEVSLAHHGVLFLDELAEFQRNVLEALREPLETGVVHVARANGHVSYPARFQLVAALNPCRCGHALDPERQCTRFPKCMRHYLDRLSGPLLDRFDIILPVPALALTTFMQGQKGPASADLQPIIIAARAQQQARQACLNAAANVSMSDLAPPAAQLLSAIAHKNSLSARGFARLLRVARTLADMDARADISDEDIALALRWRQFPDSVQQA